MARHLAKQKKNNVAPRAAVAENTTASASAPIAIADEVSPLPPASTPEIKWATSPIQKSKNLNFIAFEEEANIVEDQEEEPVVEVLEPIEIDSNTFEESWQKYIQFLNEDGNVGLATSFTEIKYTLNKNIIMLEVASATMEELILKNRSSLINFFRKELHNATVELETRMMANAHQVNIKSRSPKDKVNDLVQRNPAVLKLIQELGLELDL
jgi:hypothetical protein